MKPPKKAVKKSSTAKRAPDRYDLAVDQLAGADEEAVIEAWCMGSEHSPLFDILPNCAYCLTQVKDHMIRFSDPCGVAPAVAKALVEDKLIPATPTKINTTRRVLNRFAYWQRRLNRAAERAATAD